MLPGALKEARPWRRRRRDACEEQKKGQQENASDKALRGRDGAITETNMTF